MYKLVKFTLAVEFTYSGDELEYCETMRDIIERARELASAEIIGEVERETVLGEG